MIWISSKRGKKIVAIDMALKSLIIFSPQTITKWQLLIVPNERINNIKTKKSRRQKETKWSHVSCFNFTHMIAFACVFAFKIKENLKLNHFVNHHPCNILDFCIANELLLVNHWW